MAFVVGLIVGGWWLALFLIGAYMLVLAGLVSPSPSHREWTGLGLRARL